MSEKQYQAAVDTPADLFELINAEKTQNPTEYSRLLADAVEDAVEGAYKDLPYAAVAQAVFALLYTHKKTSIIPESLLELGRADDSSVVRAVLIQNEKAFAIYAGKQGFDWQRITSQP